MAPKFVFHFFFCFFFSIRTIVLDSVDLHTHHFVNIMVSLLHASVIGILLLVVICAQAKPLLETSNDNDDKKSPMDKQQLYELYKSMRTDPRLASVSNNDIVSYIYRKFVFGNGNDVDRTKPTQPSYRRHRYQQALEVE